MNMLLLKGNPRKNGITEMLCGIFRDGAESAGAEIEEVRLADMDIRPCIGCYACAVSPESKCVHADDMEGLRQKFSRADAIICATPVYFYAMSAPMKNFWDRCFPFICGYEKSNGGWINKTQFAVKNKKFLSINVGSGRFADTYAPVVSTWETIAKSMGFETVANIVRSESLYFTHPNQKFDTVRRIKDAVRSAGRQLAEKGRIDRRTLAAIEHNLSESDEVFAYNSNIFWQRLKSGAKNIADAGDKSCINDPRSMLASMRERFNPKRAPHKAVIAFSFSDTGSQMALMIDGGKCALEEDYDGNSDLKINTDTRSWAEFLNGRGKVIEQIARAEIVLEGDPHLFTRLKRLFEI